MGKHGKGQKMIGVWMSPEEKAVLKKMAAARGMTMSDILRADIRKWLTNEQEHEQKKKK